MKKLFAFFTLICVFAALLSACAADPLYRQNATEAETRAADQGAATLDQADYDRSFSGMQKYLIDLGLLYDTTQKEKKVTTTKTIGEILGASSGIRYTLNGSAFVEFYEYKEKNEISEKIFSEIKKDGTFSIAGLDKLTGVLSSSGKYLCVYNAAIKYDGYPAIIDAFEKF